MESAWGGGGGVGDGSNKYQGKGSFRALTESKELTSPLHFEAIYDFENQNMCMQLWVQA